MVEKFNERLLKIESVLLENDATLSFDAISEISALGVGIREAVGLLIASGCGLDFENKDDLRFYNEWLLPSLMPLDVNWYSSDPYLKQVHIEEDYTIGNIELRYQSYKPFQLIPCGDLWRDNEDRLRAPLGWFDREMKYPALLENNREWMCVIPNEIETMRSAIEQAHGKVIVLGLGLGYFTMRVAMKEDVKQIIVIEKNHSIIEIVKKYLIQQFPNNEKITIIEGDAFKYMQKTQEVDFVFADLWHDVSDGISMYKQLKELEPLNPNAQWMYWIENSMKQYIQ